MISWRYYDTELQVKLFDSPTIGRFGKFGHRLALKTKTNALQGRRIKSLGTLKR